MAKDILKEAIADAKAVREVALANAKAALEEAFTPKLQSMLSAKLSEDLDEGMHDEDDMDEGMHDEDDLDEEIDLEEILNELELEEDDSILDEEEDLEEAAYPNYKADQVQKNYYTSSDINRGLNESEEFDLDALLNEINSLEEENVEEGHCYDEDGKPMPEAHCYEEGKKEDLDEGLKDTFMKIFNNPVVKKLFPEEYYGEDGKFLLKKFMEDLGDAASGATATGTREGKDKDELEETKAALEAIQTELNEVNLLNSKLLYVNRIFKANTLDESQKLRVVETLDKAGSVKEAKLIYETIKDTFNVAKSTKTNSKKRSIREGLGMASKAAGTSTAPKREVISESTDMVARFKKLANIKINE